MRRPRPSRRWIEPALWIGVPLLIYALGWHTTVLGTLQRGLLWTGLFDPEITRLADPPAADYRLRLRTLDGERHSLAELRGKTVFLNFWASWCPPCVAEMPGIAALHERLGDEVAFVLVNMDADPAAARQFLERHGYQDLPVYRPVGSIPDAYVVSTIPSSYVLSPEGRIVVEHTGLGHFDTAHFRRLLRGLADAGPT